MIFIVVKFTIRPERSGEWLDLVRHVWMPDVVASTPEIINVEAPGTGWSEMSKVKPRG